MKKEYSYIDDYGNFLKIQRAERQK